MPSVRSLNPAASNQLTIHVVSVRCQDTSQQHQAKTMPLPTTGGTVSFQVALLGQTLTQVGPAIVDSDLNNEKTGDPERRARGQSGVRRLALNPGSFLRAREARGKALGQVPWGTPLPDL